MRKLLLGLLLLPSIGLGAQLQSQRFFANNGGLVDHLSPLRIPDNTATDINNITMDDRGQLSKRNGYSVIASTSAMIGFSTWSVNGGGYHNASSGNNFFAVVVGTAVYKTSTALGSWTSVSGINSITATVTNLAQVTDLQDSLVFCNEVDKPFYLKSTGVATAISTDTFSAAKTCGTYGAYLVVGNTTESSVAFPSRVRWSDINNINSFPALNYIDVEPDDGDKIVAIIAFDESIYIFKHRAIYKMLITGLDGPDAFIIRPLSRNIGAWAKNSVRVIPSVGIAFLAQNTAYLLNNDGLNPIGDPIQRTFDTVSRGNWANAVGGVYPHKYQYWLAVSTAGATNTEVLVYDYVQKNWTIFTNMNVNMLAQTEDSSGQNILVSGDYMATAYKQDTGSTDNPGGVASGISASYTTANLLMGGTPEITKGFKYLYIFTQGDVNYTLNVKAAYDYISTYEYSKDVQIGSAGSVYGTGIYDTDVYPASGVNVTRLELNRSSQAIKIKFSNATSGEVFGVIGWTVVYSLEDYKQ